MWLWLVGVGLVALGVFLWRSQPPKSEPVSELASNLTRRDGRLYLTGATTAFTGWMLERYPDATLKSRSWISNGQLYGVSEGWFTNGVMQVQEHFVAGTGEGPVTKWHANGTKLSEGIARAGKLEGSFRRWHENGVLAAELTLREGQPDGISRAWFPSGSLKAEVTLQSGQIVTQKFWKDGEHPPEPVLANIGGGR